MEDFFSLEAPVEKIDGLFKLNTKSRNLSKVISPEAIFNPSHNLCRFLARDKSKIESQNSILFFLQTIFYSLPI